ncbi:secreted frizzled-related protein 1-like, partial [Hypomesus transpacificus]|uniref:secreted frizzled-related protein 1-like n=1 Tax=Hypomesus transpacificus TaxID=137520 RepID=UPI001F0850CD
IKNTTSRCVNHAYTLPPKFLSVKRKFGSGGIFCIFRLHSQHVVSFFDNQNHQILRLTITKKRIRKCFTHCAKAFRLCDVIDRCSDVIARCSDVINRYPVCSDPAALKACPPCDNELKADTIMEHYCASDFALRMKIKEVKKERGDRKLIAAPKKKKVLKQGVLRKKDLKKLTLYIKNGANCPCSQLDSLATNFLIMGRKVDQQLLLMSIHKWEKKSKELKFAIKYMKSHQCPTYHTVFQ